MSLYNFYVPMHVNKDTLFMCIVKVIVNKIPYFLNTAFKNNILTCLLQLKIFYI